MIVAYLVVRLSSSRIAYPSYAALGTFLVWGFLMGFTFYINTDYPCFLWIVDENTECGFKNETSGMVEHVEYKNS